MVKGLIPHLEAIISTYSRNLSLEGLLSFCHPYNIALLLDLISGLLDHLQLLLQGDNLLFGGSQLVLSLVKEHSLTFSLPLSPVLGSFSTFSVTFCLYQLTLELLITLDSSPFFFLYLPVAEICYLLCPKRGLNSLPRKETR